MAEFFAWGWQARSLVTLLLALCVLAQTLSMVLSFYSRKRRLRALGELVLLVSLLFFSLLYGQMLNSFSIGLLAPAGYGPLRIGLEDHAFALIFLAAMLLLLARGIYVCLRRLREIRTSISALSVKNAMDSLHTGVLFSAPDGFTLLSNARMQTLMTAITGKVQRDGWDFYNLLVYGNLMPGCRKTEFEGQVVCLLPDHTAWKFTRTELHVGRRTYIQLTAADITERWELTARLQGQNEQLRQRSETLRETIANLHILSQERETQKAKMRAHDILGQRMTLLLRTVRNEQALDYSLLRSLSQGLLEELKTGQGAPGPGEFLDSLRQEFASVGVGIRLEGALPEDRAKGLLFADIVREGVTNAVRHGFATEITIQVEHTDGGCRMQIANNGLPPSGGFREGGGLGGMRKKLEPYGGALRVVSHPRFALEIDLPGDDACV